MPSRHFGSQSPKRINVALLGLIKYLGLDWSNAVPLKFTRPTAFEPEPDFCHFNVWLQIRHTGGEPQSGWILVQDNQTSFSEAIFHSVWRAPDGRLVDVTPRRDLEKRILFIPDHTRSIVLVSYKGLPAIHTFDNVRYIGSSLMTPLTRITVVISGDFIHRQGLWPW